MLEDSIINPFCGARVAFVVSPRYVCMATLSSRADIRLRGDKEGG